MQRAVQKFKMLSDGCWAMPWHQILVKVRCFAWWAGLLLGATPEVEMCCAVSCLPLTDGVQAGVLWSGELCCLLQAFLCLRLTVH